MYASATPARRRLATNPERQAECLLINDLISKLRRVINQQSGYRNFSQFLNHCRIARAQEQLADPALRYTSILTLTLELGYGSIGPFNRAFREQTGVTPTQFRKSAR